MDLYLIVCISAHAAPQTFSFYASGNLHDLSQAAYLPTDRENQPAGSIPAGCALFAELIRHQLDQENGVERAAVALQTVPGGGCCALWTDASHSAR